MSPTADGHRRTRVGYAGDDSYVTCLQALLDRSDVELVIVLTAADDRYTATVRQLSAGAGAAVISGKPGPAGWAEVDRAGLDLLVSAAYGHRIPVGELASVGTMVNVHPSLLPEGRGPNPLPYIADGHPEAAGVTLHLVDENFDTGPILLQQRFEALGDRPSLIDLTLSAMAVGPALLDSLLDDVDRHVAGARPQAAGSYWPGISHRETVVDLATATGKQLEAAVHRLGGQGLTLRLCDGSALSVGTAHFAPAPHRFLPGRLLGRLRGDFLLSIDGGLVRASPFIDDPFVDDPFVDQFLCDDQSLCDDPLRLPAVE